MHVAEKVNKAYSMLWLIKRNFKDIGAEAFVTLYKHLIRSHLGPDFQKILRYS